MKIFATIGFAAALSMSASAWAQTTTRVSVSTTGAQADTSCFATSRSITADGRYVVFDSRATTLVPGNTAGVSQVFLRDRQTGAIEIISVNPSGNPGNAGSTGGTISADGRYVAFVSNAFDLVPGDVNGFSDIFVRDRQTGTTELLHVAIGGTQGNEQMYVPVISADGSAVAFQTAATNLVAGDTNGVFDIFVYDRTAAMTTLVSVNMSGLSANAPSYSPAISGDGRYVAFTTVASDIVPNDTNNLTDVFVRDRQTATTELVSVSTTGGVGDKQSFPESISPDGRFVVFASWADDLVAGDTNGAVDVFLRDRLLGTTELVSIGAGGVQEDNASTLPSLSDDGRYVAFWSRASNLLGSGPTRTPEVYVRDRQLGTNEVVSQSSGGTRGNGTNLISGFSSAPALSSEGRFIAFYTNGTNLVPNDTNGWYDVFLRDRGPRLLAYCFGDGTGAACPCGNSGAPTHGCENSQSTGGAILSAAGSSSLGGDNLVFTSSNELPSALSIVLQGNATASAASFGDGLRCVSGALKRLYVKNAVGGVATAPTGTDPSVSTRSAAEGDLIPAGASRFYQVYYRDPSPSFCAAPQGNTWNISSGLAIVWDY
jgi:Tol biopolymer transport system component